LDWPKNSKNKVEQPLFFIVISSYEEMSFRAHKKEKKSLNRVETFIFFKWFNMGIKNVNFTFVASSFQKFVAISLK
jgi:hypothetical protein